VDATEGGVDMTTCNAPFHIFLQNYVETKQSDVAGPNSLVLKLGLSTTT
jgi:hypothetical protein